MPRADIRRPGLTAPRPRVLASPARAGRNRRTAVVPLGDEPGEVSDRQVGADGLDPDPLISTWIRSQSAQIRATIRPGAGPSRTAAGTRSCSRWAVPPGRIRPGCHLAPRWWPTPRGWPRLDSPGQRVQGRLRFPGSPGATGRSGPAAGRAPRRTGRRESPGIDCGLSLLEGGERPGGIQEVGTEGAVEALHLPVLVRRAGAVSRQLMPFLRQILSNR